MLFSFDRLKLFAILWILFFLGVSFPLEAKKKEAKSAVSYKELAPSKKLIYLTNLIFSGQTQEAAQRFFETGDLKVDHQLKNRLQFIQAYLQLMSGNAKNAAELFKALQGKYPEVNPILPYWTGKAERLSGNPKKALATLEASCGGPCLAPSRMVREYGLSLCESGEGAKAEQIFGELLSKTSKGMDRAFIRMDSIDCRIKTGKADEAYQELRSLYIQAPAGIPPEQLRSLLLSLNRSRSSLPASFSAEDELNRIRGLRAQERWVEAAQELKKLLPSFDSASQASLRSEAAEIFFKARSYREAATQYEKLVQEAATSADRKEMLEKLGSAYARSNQFDQAIQTQKELESASDEASSKRSYKIAFLLADAGRCEEATKAFQDFLNLYPKNNKRDDALWQMAWCSYQLKKYDAALRSLDQLDDEFTRSSFSPRVAYWRYRILEAAGRSSEANEAKQILSGKYGQNFYQRWENQYGKIAPAQCPTAASPALTAKNEKRLFQGMFGSRNPSESSTLRELLSLGLWEDFLEIYQKGGTSSSGDMNDQMGDWIRFFADTEQVPPELVWAVMREESHFKSQALSSAGAMGLMQIIPQTGHDIAQSLKLSSFDSEDLFQPLINVRFGVHYLGQLLRKFSGNLIQAIAAYNAGPEAVERWQGQRPNSPCDEFIEQIPYVETHNYVKKVMRSFWDYRDNPSSVTQASNE